MIRVENGGPVLRYGARIAFAVVAILSVLLLAGPATAVVSPTEAAPTIAPASAPVTGPVDPVVRDALRNIVTTDDIQTQFTVPPEQPRAETPEWIKRMFGWLMNDGVGTVQIAGWALVAMIVLGALYLTVPWLRDLVDSLIARFRKTSDNPHGDTIEWRPDEGGARNLLAEADRLAALGQFEAAAHLLLGRSLEDIANRRPGLLKPALTARAIALMAELPDPARAAFGRITAVVERSLWARQPLDQPAWQDARTAYEDFAFGQHWRGVVT